MHVFEHDPVELVFVLKNDETSVQTKHARITASTRSVFPPQFNFCVRGEQNRAALKAIAVVESITRVGA